MTGQRQWNSTLTRSKGLAGGGQLARTELARGVPLQRHEWPRRGNVIQVGTLENVVAFAPPRRTRPRRPPAELTFPPEVEALVIQAYGGRCFLAGWTDPPCWGQLAAHHRQLKGMGGSKRPGLHVASMGVLLCAGHHIHWTHLCPLEAKEYGLIIPRNQAALPSTHLPVSADRRTLRWLTDDGRMLTEAPLPEPASVA